MSAMARAWRKRFADWWESRDGLAADQVSMARQIRANVARHDATERELAAIRAELATCHADNRALAAGLCQALALAGKPVPPELAANAQTQPLPRLRSVG